MERHLERPAAQHPCGIAGNPGDVIEEKGESRW
jgi:hypothetical protein